MTLTRPHQPWRRAALWHGCALTLLLGGFFVSQLFAQGERPPAPAVPAVSLLDRWLSPDVVIGGVLVLLYAGELRGDIRRLKEDQATLATRLHDDYIPRREVEALLGRRVTDRI